MLPSLPSVAAAYGFSVFALLFPQLLPAAFVMNGAPPLYFEAAAIITTLVILGQVLELRARSQPRLQCARYSSSRRRPR